MIIACTVCSSVRWTLAGGMRWSCWQSWQAQPHVPQPTRSSPGPDQMHPRFRSSASSSVSSKHPPSIRQPIHKSGARLAGISKAIHKHTKNHYAACRRRFHSIRRPPLRLRAYNAAEDEHLASFSSQLQPWEHCTMAFLGVRILSASLVQDSSHSQLVMAMTPSVAMPSCA